MKLKTDAIDKIVFGRYYYTDNNDLKYNVHKK